MSETIASGGWLVGVLTPASAGVPARHQRFYISETDRTRAKDLLGQRMRISPAETCTFLEPVSRETLSRSGLRPGEIKALHEHDAGA